MESICVTWIASERQYLVTVLTHKDGLIKKYVKNMHEFMEYMQEVEDKYAT